MAGTSKGNSRKSSGRLAGLCSRWGRAVRAVGASAVRIGRKLGRMLLSPAFWAAVAAAFAAIAAWLSYVQQERSAINAVRPELIVTRWDYRVEKGLRIVTVGTIENAGNGHAFHVIANDARLSPKSKEEERIVAFSTMHMPILRTGESKEVDWEYVLPESETADDNALPTMLALQFTSWDVNRNRYQTAHSLMVKTSENVLCPGEEVAPDLYLWDRRTTFSSRSRWSTAYH